MKQACSLIALSAAILMPLSPRSLAQDNAPPQSDNRTVTIDVLPPREIAARLGDDAQVRQIGFVKGLRYILPMYWKKEQPSNPMRLVQVRIPPLFNETHEPGLMVISGGIGGSVEDNVARWVAQFTDIEGVATQQDLPIAGTPLLATEVIVTGTYNAGMPGGEPDPKPGTTLYGAIVQGGPEGTIFIKATGPKETMAERRQSWDIFIRNLKIIPRPKDAPLPPDAPGEQQAPPNEPAKQE